MGESKLIKAGSGTCDKLSSISWVVVFQFFQFWLALLSRGTHLVVTCGKTVPSFEVSCGIWRRSNELTRAV